MSITLSGERFKIDGGVTFDDTDDVVHNQAATVLPDGRTVVVWHTFNNDGGAGGISAIRGRILNADGTPAGVEFLVNTTTVGDQVSPSVEALSNGQFVVSWQSMENGDGGTVTADSCIRARVFNSDGVAASYDGTGSGTSTNDFVVNTLPGYHQGAPSIVALDSGGFAIAFQSQVVENFFAGWQIEMRRYASTGPTGPETAIQSIGGPVDDGFEPSMTRLTDGRFVVAWHNSTTNGGEVKARVFLSDGTPDPAANGGNEFFLNTSADNSQRPASIAALPGNKFVAVWHHSDVTTGDGSNTSIRGRIFNGDGTPVTVSGSTDDFQINAHTPDHQLNPDVVSLADGRFLVTYKSRSSPAGEPVGDSLLGRFYNADGTPDGLEVVIAPNDATYPLASDGFNSTVRMADGRIMAVFDRGAGADTILGRFLDWRIASVTFNGDGDDNQYVGTSLADTLNGNGGKDRLSGGAGDDLFVYGANSSSDIITDFVAGTGTEDKIDLTAFTDIHTLGDVLSRATQVGADTVIDFGGGNTLTLNGVTRANLADEDFLFSAGPTSAPPQLDLDQSASGIGFVTAFTEGGAAAPVVDTDVLISDSDSGTMASARIVLTNAKADDALAISGPLPAGISGAIDTSVSGQITVTLTGSASLTSYQTALRQVVFANSGDNPDTTSRIITIVVNDGTADSPIAQATISVASVSEPTQVRNDFDGDGNADILFQNSDGTPAVWLIDGVGLSTMGPPLPNPGAAWTTKEFRRLQRRRQGRHPLAERRRHAGRLADGRRERARHRAGPEKSRTDMARDRVGRLQRRQQERHPVAERRRHACGVDDERRRCSLNRPRALQPGRELARQGRGRLQRRRQGRHPLAERRRHAGGVADGRRQRALGADRRSPIRDRAGMSRRRATSTATARPTFSGRTPTARRRCG